jgi:hypothetical protein
MQQGKDAFVSKNGNWVKEGVLSVSKKGIFLVKSSPIIANAKKATQRHREGKEFYLTEEQVAEALESSVALSGESIPTNRFGEDAITVFAFEDIAQRYGDFLRDAGIEQMPIYLANREKKPFARQLWFSWLGGGSGLNGYSRGLYCDGSTRGVRSVVSGAEGAEKTYTLDQISAALKKANLSGLESILKPLL